VSCPVFVALTLSRLLLFIVAPITSSPFVLSIGILSPVTADSSIDDDPSITFPSVGILSPGLITMTSSSCTCSIGISTSSSTTFAPPPFCLSTLAILG
jgi:hypothetical protein